MARTQITIAGIRKHVRSFAPEKAVSEYIWNGFDAGADTICLDYKTNSIGTIESFSIADNGSGIPKEKLKEKFEPFYESHKKPNSNASLPHGRNGFGRFSFIQFATEANWQITYKEKNNRFQQYNVQIFLASLIEYKDSKAETITAKDSGTKISFSSFTSIEANFFEETLPTYLAKEFSWFLELNANFKILINGKLLNYRDLIVDCESKPPLEILHKKSGICFSVKFFQWKEKLHEEYSKFYYLDSYGNEVWKENTSFNNQGDRFYHSIYIQSSYFNDFDFETSQSPLLGANLGDEIFKFLQKEIQTYLNEKRRPYVRRLSDKLIEDYEKEGILEENPSDDFQALKRTQLEEVIRKLYIAKPKIFNQLNVDQKKIFTGFLEGLLDANERDTLLKIIEKVLNLSTKEKEEFAEILENAELSNVIDTLKVIESRYKVYYELYELVTNKFLGADESHIQRIIENNTWLFGEEYHIVTAEEPKFEEALRRYRYLLDGKETEAEVNHPDKNKEMDIFACRKRPINGHKKIENIVIELKNPNVNLGQKELEQVNKYMRVIRNTDDFNNTDTKWVFILVGNRFSTPKGESTEYIQDEIKQLRSFGKPYLAKRNVDLNYEIYVKKWSEVFEDFRNKHEFINEKLKARKELLVSKAKTADEAVKFALNNEAANQQKHWDDKKEKQGLKTI